MKYSEVTLINPVTSESVDKLFDEIKACTSEYLVINTGNHEFASLDVLKKFKEMFSLNKVEMSRFKKIAFLHPEGYANHSDEPDKYNYFSSMEEVLNWLGL